MVNLLTYQKYWKDINEPLKVIADIDLDKKIKDGTSTFLKFWGLPIEAAPFLSFSQLEEGKLSSVEDVFDIKSAYAKFFIMLGTNGSGDPICIDTDIDDEIIYLNHDNNFERIYINKNITKFALCLLRYDQFLKSSIDYSNDKLKKKSVSINVFDKLRSDFNAIDDTCLSKRSFWYSELNELLFDLKIN